MRLLVLGGTAWLGAQIARSALARGHQVTCLARGATATPPPGSEFVRADRDVPDAYDEVRTRDWDAMIDVTRQPGQARDAARALADRTAHAVLVSSGNVYADHRRPGQDESGPVLAPLAGDVMVDMATYGEAKVACEQHVRTTFGADRSLVVRVGLIGGPGDLFDRTGYWPARFAVPADAGGAVLVPDALDQPTQVIDVRDLADWLVTAAERRTSGVGNATGDTLTLADHLDLARAAAGHHGELVAVDPAWLLAHDVQAWMGPRSLPLWLDDPDWRGFNARDSSWARAAGLTVRPLLDTLTDTLAWERSRPGDRERRAGLTPADERALLAAWRGR